MSQGDCTAVYIQLFVRNLAQRLLSMQELAGESFGLCGPLDGNCLGRKSFVHLDQIGICQFQAGLAFGLRDRKSCRLTREPSRKKLRMASIRW